MPRRLPLLSLTALAVVVGAAVFRPALGQGPPAGPPDPPGGPEVEVSLTDKTTLTGVIRGGSLTLRTDYGSDTFEWGKVKRVTLAGSNEPAARDTVELADKTIRRGRVTADAFEVATAGGVKTVPRAAVREVKRAKAHDLSPAALVLGLLTLSLMEIVLGIDNVIFLAIVAGRLPEHQRPKARQIGLAAALGTRLLLLFSLSFLLGLTAPIFTLPDLPLVHDLEAREVSWRDVILLAGGLFLIGKSVFEMHEKIEHARKASGTAAGAHAAPAAVAGFAQTIVTIAVIDIVFSLDSVITAVGMVEDLWVMVAAMVAAMGVMLFFAGYISDFVDRHPTIKVLALAFLILIGVMLVAEGLGQHIDKGYIYFAMAFGVGVEFVNMKLRKSPPTPAADPASSG